MTAAEVKDALRRRHPALWPGFRDAPGEWVCLEEWSNLDLVAFHCWGKYERIGYEVKVSRADLRRELLAPHKREPYKRHVDQLYLAVPDGLLKPAELDFTQPDWATADFEPQWCDNEDCRLSQVAGAPSRYRRSSRGPHAKGKSWEGATIMRLGSYRDTGTRENGSTYSHSGPIEACCNVCKGRGKVGPSRVEREAPHLWVPPDIGLVVIYDSGTRAVRKAPKLEVPKALGPKALADLVRWASFRGDPRHRPAVGATGQASLFD